jgi:hypothetical protein
MVVLVMLFSTAAVVEATRLTSLHEPDVWWHLRTGAWILHNHAFPHNGLFSQYSWRPWMAYSWGYEVLLATLYKILGLRAIPVYLMGMKIAIAVMAYKLARGARAGFWPAVVLATAAQYAMPDLQPRPGLFSILLFGIELLLLFRSRHIGSARPLHWLPLVFLLWANLHIQFIYGLLALAILVAAVLTEEIGRRLGLAWFEGQASQLSPVPVVVMAGVSVLATLLSPYSYHLYQIVLNYARSSISYYYVSEAMAMSFRRPQHFVLLLLAMAAFFAAGRQRRLNLFKICLLAMAAIVTFRAQRETWVVVLVAVAVLADGPASRMAPESGTASGKKMARWPWEGAAVAALVILVFAIAILVRVPSRRDDLLRTVGETYPVRACDYILAHHLPPPIFNDFTWGGFLIWYLPGYPVAIDGRTDLYGDEVALRQFKIANGDLPPWSEPTFAGARTLILPRHSGMAEALAEVSSFRVAYEDDQAMVLLQR